MVTNRSCFARVLQLSVDDISMNADVYGGNAGNYKQLKVRFVQFNFHARAAVVCSVRCVLLYFFTLAGNLVTCDV